MALRRITYIAEELDVSVPRAYALIREGTLRGVRLGRQVRVADEELERFIAAGGKGLNAPRRTLLRPSRRPKQQTPPGQGRRSRGATDE